MCSGTKLRNYRKALKLNQTQFANKMGITQSALSLIESGRISLSQELETDILPILKQQGFYGFLFN